MSTYGCRHTLTQVFVYQPWTVVCMFCLEKMAPFTTARRCTACHCTIHENCYRQMVSMMQAAGEIMGQEVTRTPETPQHAEGGVPPPKLSSEEGVKSNTEPQLASADAVAATTEGAGNASDPTMAAKAPKGQVMTAVASVAAHVDAVSQPTLATAERSTSSAVPWRSPQQAPLASSHVPPATTDESPTAPPQTPSSQLSSEAPPKPQETGFGEAVAAFFSSPTSAVNAFAKQVQMSASSSSFSVSSPTWWRPVSTDGSTSAAARASSQTGRDPSPVHTHTLQPTTFLFPTQCVCCYTNKTPAEQRAVAARAQERSGGVVRVAAAGGDEASAPTSSWMGLGTAGYECTTCPACLHRVCLYCLDPATYAIRAPQAKAMSSDSEEENREEGGTAEHVSQQRHAGEQRPGKGKPNDFLAFFSNWTPSAPSREPVPALAAVTAESDQAVNGGSNGATALKAAALASVFQQFMKGLQGGEAGSAAGANANARSSGVESTAAAAAAPLHASPTWNASKTLITSYLSASGRNAKNDPNFAAILRSVFHLMDTLQLRHPDILSAVFNPVSMHLLSVADQARYERLCEELPDADFILRATGREEQVLAREAAAAAKARTSQPVKEERDKAGGGVKVAGDKWAAEGTHTDAEEKDAKVWTNVLDEGVAALLGTDEDTVKDEAATVYETIQKEQETNADKLAQRQAKNATVNYLPEIQLMRDALRFAIAVYGDTYRRGFLSSIFSSALVFTVSKDDIASQPKEVNDAAVTEVLSLPRSALVLSRWSSISTEPSYCLLVDHIPQRIVVAFRGTLSDVDILTDICAFGEDFCGGKAHQGAVGTINRIFNSPTRANKTKDKPGDPAVTNQSGAPSDVGMDTKTAREGPTDGAAPGAEAKKKIRELKESFAAQNLITEDDPDKADHLLNTLERLALAYPTYDIIVTGHSLGGGLAVLFGVRVSYDRTFAESILKRMRVIAFAPMPTLSMPSAAAYDAPPPARPQRSGTKPNGAQDATTSSVADARASGGVGDDESHYAFPIWSVINGCDIVGRLQVNSIDRLCARISGDGVKGDHGDHSNELPTAASAARGAGRPKSVQKTADGGVREDPDEGTEMVDRSGGKAGKRSPSQTSSLSPLSEELYHPGRIFMTTTPWEVTTNRLVEVPRKHAILHDIALMRPMLALHMMDNYTEGLRTIRSSLQVARSTATADVANSSSSSDADSTAGSDAA